MRKRDNEFGLIFTGFIEVPTEGTYTFHTDTKAAVRIWIGDTVILDQDGTREGRRGAVALAAGKHALKLVYYNGRTEPTLEISWEGPGIKKHLIPAGVLSHVPAEKGEVE